MFYKLKVLFASAIIYAADTTLSLEAAVGQAKMLVDEVYSQTASNTGGNEKVENCGDCRRERLPRREGDE
jgi:hypothetical protein